MSIISVDVTIIEPTAPALPVFEIVDYNEIRTNARQDKLCARLEVSRGIAIIMINKVPNRRRAKRWRRSDRLAIWYGDVPTDQLPHMADQIKYQLEQSFDFSKPQQAYRAQAPLVPRVTL